MTQIARETINTDGGQVEIWVEVDDVGPQREWKTRQKTTEITTEAFSEGMALIRTCAEQVAETVGKVSERARPNAVEVQLGIKLVAEAGALIAKTGAEGHLQVKLSWNRK